MTAPRSGAIINPNWLERDSAVVVAGSSDGGRTGRRDGGTADGGRRTAEEDGSGTVARDTQAGNGRQGHAGREVHCGRDVHPLPPDHLLLRRRCAVLSSLLTAMLPGSAARRHPRPPIDITSAARPSILHRSRRIPARANSPSPPYPPETFSPLLSRTE
jgi:hypothetical protein